jgi:hypothetical protein
LGQTEPLPLHVKVQVELLSQVTLSSLQSAPAPQAKLQCWPGPQCAVPLQVLPAPSQSKLQAAPGSQATARQLPPPQRKLQAAPLLQRAPSQLPIAQFSEQAPPLSHTTPAQRPRALQAKLHVAS